MGSGSGGDLPAMGVMNKQTTYDFTVGSKPEVY